ncbi:MAG: hypothetical protein WA125_13640, partial [Desulfosporosinus sp.]
VITACSSSLRHGEVISLLHFYPAICKNLPLHNYNTGGAKDIPPLNLIKIKPHDMCGRILMEYIGNYRMYDYDNAILKPYTKILQIFYTL